MEVYFLVFATPELDCAPQLNLIVVVFGVDLFLEHFH